MARTKEELLKGLPIMYGAENGINGKILLMEAMESYHQEKLREELELFAKHINKIGWSIPKNEVDNFLKSR
jgi:hypothetical protein